MSTKIAPKLSPNDAAQVWFALEALMDAVADVHNNIEPHERDHDSEEALIHASSLALSIARRDPNHPAYIDHSPKEETHQDPDEKYQSFVDSQDE